ncbi:MAG: UvrD-helicase domain-containing protein [Clostridium sp.]|nr:UvrD-helicase domain-containing protein [Prevotella sp.]MCM1428814.1 UvrD-helicase domain-containing protein [Clostridium sp.]MCM1475189.1 UvrD-helicase domain-containing protein [Muribaculaceae bacterium]
MESESEYFSEMDSNYNYLDLLNPQQRDAVVYNDGPQLVIAGAGSGKTRVLTYKIVHLLRTGIEPWRILALTFTNKAAREMKDRIMQIVGPNVASRLWAGTFHSIFLRILRRHADRLGYSSNFTIYDANDSRSLIKMIIKEMELDEKVYKVSVVASAISNAKNALITPERYAADADIQKGDRNSRRPLISTIYKRYCQRCKISSAMDFDDILVNMNILLRDNPDILEYYQDFFRYILVDEYQDTNFAQHLIINQLSDKRRKLCVVGDDAQSIYSFRGANISNILTLNKQFPDLQIFKLERNYRSTQNIVDASGSLIAKNVKQLPKQVYSENEKGDPIFVVKTYSDMEEAFLVANRLNEIRQSAHESYDEFAILYRTNAQSRILEEALRKRNIPYRIYGGLSFYQRKEIKDAISYFRLTVNPDDDEALRRIINFPARGIGETTMKKLTAAASEANVSIWTVVNNPEEYKVNINKGTIGKLNAFSQMIKAFIADNNTSNNAYQTGQLIINRTGLLSSLAHDNTPESISKQENLSELLAGLKEFVELRLESGEDDLSMSSFLSEVSLATDQDETEKDNGPKVNLMTVHASKGLEFNNIFIVGVEEELFPSAMSMDSELGVEEERRLLYVAITRARKRCVITYSGTRFRNGQTVFSRPSRFLRDIDKKYLNYTSSMEMEFDSPSSSSRIMGAVNNYSRSMLESPSLGSDNNFSGISSSSRNARRQGGLGPTVDTTTAQEISSALDGTITQGTRINHGRFGVGIVRKIEVAGESEVLTVDFASVGIKRLLLKYAKFTILP